MTFLSSRYGMSLSPMIVTRLLSASFAFSTTSRPTCRSSSALSGWIRSPSTESASITDDTTRPPTRISVPVMTTSSVSFGAFCDIDSGSLTARGLAIVSTPPAFESRKKIRIVNTSMSETRFMSTIVPWRLRRSARFCKGVIVAMAALLLPDRRVADRDVGEVVGDDDACALHLVPGADRVHHLHQRVVGDVGLGQHRGLGLVGELELDALDQRRQRLHVGLAADVRDALDQPADAVADLERLGPDHDLELQVVLGQLFELLVLLRRQAQVDDREMGE